MNKKIKPLGSRVLIKRLAANASKGGIILPDTAKEKQKIGEVIAVGEGKYDNDGKNIPMDIKVGEKVLFSSYAGTEVMPDMDEDYLIMNEDEIFAIIE